MVNSFAIASAQRLLSLPQSVTGTDVYWLGQRGEDALSIAMVKPLAGVICANWSTELSGWSNHIPIYSSEYEDRQRLSLSSNELQELATRWLSTLPPHVPLVSYKNIPRLSAMNVIGPDHELVCRLDDKQFQRPHFQRLGLHTPAFFPVNQSTSLEEIKSLASTSGAVMMVPKRGSMGKGVEKLDAEQLTPQTLTTYKDFLCSSFVEGVAVNTSAVITEREIRLSWPSVQILGEPALNAPSSFAYCGNDFTATNDFDTKDLNALASDMYRLCVSIRDLGYRGFLGADWILDGNGNWWLIEVNPRMQGSTLALSLLERHHDQPLSVASWLAPDAAIVTGFGNPLKGCQLIAYAPVHNASCARAVADSPISDPWYVIGAPVPGTAIDPFAPFCRLLSLERSMALEQNRLCDANRPAIQQACLQLMG